MLLEPLGSRFAPQFCRDLTGAMADEEQVFDFGTKKKKKSKAGHWIRMGVKASRIIVILWISRETSKPKTTPQMASRETMAPP